ncbi:hypothetical protein CHUAL_001160 [Chamberlinius hualienensis]
MGDNINKLSDSERATIERNRQHALLLRQARLASHPYLDKDSCVTRIEGSKLIDSGSGFFIEESALSGSSSQSKPLNIIHPTATTPFDTSEALTCTECDKTFHESYLKTTFDVSVCNDCRDNEEKHALITKSDAKTRYLLNEVDLEKREPKLKFIIRKNPHNQRWGDMKLFLESQVFERAIEVWGSEEQIEEEREKRTDKREKSRRKKFEKSVKELRMAVRSSTYTKDLRGHQHEFGEETYDENDDSYTKTCKTCGHQLNYERM